MLIFPSPKFLTVHTIVIIIFYQYVEKTLLIYVYIFLILTVTIFLSSYNKGSSWSVSLNVLYYLKFIIITKVELYTIFSIKIFLICFVVQRFHFEFTFFFFFNYLLISLSTQENIFYICYRNFHLYIKNRIISAK